MLLSADDGSFARTVLQAAAPTVVAFGAAWCGHCRRLEPVLESLAGAGQRIVRVDIDQSPRTARRYGVGSIPALYCFRQGEAGQPLVGPGSRAEIESWLAAQQG